MAFRLDQRGEKISSLVLNHHNARCGKNANPLLIYYSKTLKLQDECLASPDNIFCTYTLVLKSTHAAILHSCQSNVEKSEIITNLTVRKPTGLLERPSRWNEVYARGEKSLTRIRQMVNLARGVFDSPNKGWPWLALSIA